MKELSFAEATKSGVSIGIDDMIIPADKAKVIGNAYSSIGVVEKQHRSGAITDGERYNKIVDVWTQANDEISSLMMRTLEHNHGRPEFNPVFIMADSGARGNKNQVRQLAGMRGLMAKPSGEIIERPLSPTSAKASPFWNTSSRRTAPARVSPIPRSRRPTPVT